MRIRHSLILGALALMLWSAPSSAVIQFHRPTHPHVGLATEKLWRVVPRSVNAQVPDAEPNDDLATAEPVACGDGIRPAAIDVPGDVDVFSFTANAGDLLTLGTDADGANPIGATLITLFDADGNPLLSDDESGPGYYSLISDLKIPTTGTYYLGIIAYDANAVGTYQAFITCRQPPPPPANDNCAGAIALPCGVIGLAGSTEGAANDYYADCTSSPAGGADVVYRVDAVAGQVIDLTYTSSADASIYLITDCADPVGSCVAGSDKTFEGEPETLHYAAAATGTYYLILDSYGPGSFGSWTLNGTNQCGAVPTRRSSWGKLKSFYR